MANSNKALYGLVGFPVKHSFSPAMHNAAFAARQIPAEYQLFELAPQELEDFLLKRKEVNGFNVTVPYKVKIAEIIQKNFPLEQDSTLIQEDLYYLKLSGAVNTVVKEGGRAYGYNTDAQGFLRSLEEDLKFDHKDKNILVLGCGGAGRAVIAALSWKNNSVKKIYVYDLRPESIASLNKYLQSLSRELRNIFESKIEFISRDKVAEVIKQCQLLVNATPLGMKAGDARVIDKKLLHGDLFVYDLVYNRDTELIQDARECCKAACSGLGMLLYQGVAAWELWRGEEAPIEVMRKALTKEIKKKC